MTKKDHSSRKAAHTAIVRRVVTVTNAAKKSAKAALITGRTLPPPVEIEPRGLDASALSKLRAERQRLFDEIKHQEILTRDQPTTGTHMADVASDVAEQATTLALRENLEGLLREVERAIVRGETGTYGLCERCGRSIGEERLQVMPSTTLCIACAQTRTNPTKAAI